MRLALILALAANAAAATVHLRVVAPLTSCRGTLIAGATRVPFAAPTDVPIAAGAAKLSIASDGCWAVPVDLPPEAGEVELRLWEVGRLHAHVAGGGGAVDSLEVRIASPPGEPPERRLPDTTIACPVVASEVRCSVPATALDLRFAAGDFVPRYFWNVRVPSGAAAELGDVRLERGASISGWVSAKGGVRLDAVTIDVAPEEFVRSGRPAGTIRTRTVRPNRRGFFQLAGVAAGSYSVTAKSEGWSPARVSDVRVAAGEVLLEQPLELQLLGRIQLTIEPALAPDHQPWHVALRRRVPLSNFIAEVLRDVATPAGTWMGSGVETGTYQLVLSDAAGSEFHRQEIDIRPGLTALPVAIRQVLVRGRVTSGGSPIRARLKFEAGGARVTLNSDEHGDYHGVLPDDGKWSVRIYPSDVLTYIDRRVTVERKSDAAEAAADIELPGGSARGIVVDDSGRAVRAEIMANRGSALVAVAGAAEDGTFSFLGLETGPLTLQASFHDAESEPVSYDVTETPGPIVRLVVHASAAVKGWVQTRRGEPVAGALLRAFHPAFGIREAVSGPSGEFTLRVPDLAARFDVAVIVPSLPVKLVQLAGGADAKPVGLIVGSVPARLHVLRKPSDRWPFVRRDTGGIVPLGLLLAPVAGGLPRGLTADGIVVDVESGRYSVCADLAGGRCETRELAPGAEAVIEFNSLFPAKTESR